MSIQRFYYMLPKMVVDITDIQDLLQAADKEFEFAEARIKKLDDDAFLNTLTDIPAALRSEKVFAVQTFGDLATRRSMLMAKLRGAGTTTEALVRNVAESFTYGEVDVLGDYPNYTVKITFIGEKGIPANLNALKRALREIIPAHLAVEYIFTYLTWDEFDAYNKSWDEWDALNLTWDEFEKYSEIEGRS